MHHQSRRANVPRNDHRRRVVAATCRFLLVAIAYVEIAAAESPRPLPAGAVLDLGGKEFLSGELVQMKGPDLGPLDILVWKTPIFQEPFHFPLKAVRGIRFPKPEQASAANTGDWVVELHGGDTLQGRLESLTDDAAFMTIGGRPAPIRIAVRRDWIRRISRNDTFTGYVGPGRLHDWNATPAGSWRALASALVGEGRSSLSRSFPSGPRCRYDLVFSWKERPVIQVSVAGGKRGSRYCLEFLDEGVMALREEAGDGTSGSGRKAMERLGDLPARGISLSLFVDQRIGRMAVRLPGMTAPGCDMVIPPSGEEIGGDFSILLRRGEVTLESIRVTPWSSDEPGEEIEQLAKLWLHDGAVIRGRITRFDVAQGAVMEVSSGADSPATARSVPAEDVVGMVFPTASPVPLAAETTARALWEVFDHWGSRICGNVVGFGGEGLLFQHPAIEGMVTLPLTSLLTLDCLDRRSEPPAKTGQVGLLECESARIPGCFVAGADDGTQTRKVILWQPTGSLTASPFTVDSSRRTPLARVSFIRDDQENRSEGSVAASGTLEGTSRVILRTGESLRCLVEASHDEELVVQVPGGGRIEVSHDAIQAVELVKSAGARLSREKFRSLTTLPRFQEHQPPTHILRSLGGDYLRGWLVSLDDETVTFAVESGGRRLPAQFPRDRVARIIWLHPESLAQDWKPPHHPDTQGLPLRFTSHTGDSMRLWVTEIDDEGMQGINPSLGPLRIAFDTVSHVDVGDVDGPAGPVEFSQWRLEPAPGPRNLPPRKPPAAQESDR